MAISRRMQLATAAGALFLASCGSGEIVTASVAEQTGLTPTSAAETRTDDIVGTTTTSAPPDVEPAPQTTDLGTTTTAPASVEESDDDASFTPSTTIPAQTNSLSVPSTTAAGPGAIDRSDPSAETAVEIFDFYIAELEEFSTLVLRNETSVFANGELLAHFDPALVEGSIDQVAVDMQECIAARDQFPASVADAVFQVNQEHLGQTRLDDSTWVIDVQLFVGIDGEQTPNDPMSFIVTIDGVGPSLGPTPPAEDCDPPPSALATSLVEQGRELVNYQGPTSVLESSTETAAE